MKDIAKTLSPRPSFWLNNSRTSDSTCSSLTGHRNEIHEAAERFARFAPLIANIFPETAATNGRVQSPLLHAEPLAAAIGLDGMAGRLLLKADHILPVAGSIKARGGIYAVLEIAEHIARRHGLLHDGDYQSLTTPYIRTLFANHRILVGSTGNLGLSVGTMASALGFKATVHMSVEAKEWKKRLLRERGAEVIEHAGDYSQALAAARASAAIDPACFFIDDENSPSLLYGYATAAKELAGQLEAAGLSVDCDHPLIVHLPCGVGGAPTGIALGLQLIFGEHVHCFFAEPVGSPCFMLELTATAGSHPSVYDAGLDGKTYADGLAVPRASMLAADIARTIIAGCFTVTDDALIQHLYLAKRSQDLQLEPSAAAGISGPLVLRESLGSVNPHHRLGETLSHSTQVIWATGGSLMPVKDHQALAERGRQLTMHQNIG